MVSASQPSLSARLTSPQTQGVTQELARLGAGLGLAALYGVALGARSGGTALVQHALGASAGLAAVGVLGIPALFVLLALVNAPVSPGAMLSAGARSLASAGFVLAGLAPSAALLAVTIESPEAAAFVTRAGLTLAGGIGLFQLTSAVCVMLKDLPAQPRLKCHALLCGFCLFAIMLAARVWYTLPILQGAA
ncbi:MAG TPA: hypothetical protein VGJ91_11880 [Polyangiaceae bacterium]|jgi:hypothetical protein